MKWSEFLAKLLYVINVVLIVLCAIGAVLSGMTLAKLGNSPIPESLAPLVLLFSVGLLANIIVCGPNDYRLENEMATFICQNGALMAYAQVHIEFIRDLTDADPTDLYAALAGYGFFVLYVVYNCLVFCLYNWPRYAEYLPKYAAQEVPVWGGYFGWLTVVLQVGNLIVALVAAAHIVLGWYPSLNIDFIVMSQYILTIEWIIHCANNLLKNKFNDGFAWFSIFHALGYLIFRPLTELILTSSYCQTSLHEKCVPSPQDWLSSVIGFTAPTLILAYAFIAWCIITEWQRYNEPKVIVEKK